MSATWWHQCGQTLGDGGVCARPEGHTSWKIETGWRHDPVTGVYGPTAPGLEISAYAHMSKPAQYDAEVWPYMQLAVSS